MIETIVTCLIIWLPIAIFGCFFAASPVSHAGDKRTMTMIFFWPVSLAVFLIIDPIFALISAISFGLDLFDD